MAPALILLSLCSPTTLRRTLREGPAKTSVATVEAISIAQFGHTYQLKVRNKNRAITVRTSDRVQQAFDRHGGLRCLRKMITKRFTKS